MPRRDLTGAAIRFYFSSCSSALNSPVLKNSPRVISRPSQIILMVIILGFLLLPYRIFLIDEGGQPVYGDVVLLTQL